MDLQEELRQEATLFVLPNKGPKIVPTAVPECPNSFLAESANLFLAGGLQGIPATATTQESFELPPLRET